MKKFKNLLILFLAGASFFAFEVSFNAVQCNPHNVCGPIEGEEVATCHIVYDECDDPAVSLNGRDLYDSISLALAAANIGDTISLVQNVTLEENLTIPAGITLASTANTLVVPEGVELTVNGTVDCSGTSKINVAGRLKLQTGGKLKIGSTLKLESTGQIQMSSDSVVNVVGTLDLMVNSKIVTEGSGACTMNVKENGSIVGNANAFDTAATLELNNYGGRVNEQIALKFAEGKYNYYAIYSENEDRYYKTLDEITGTKEVKLIAPLTINGDAKINEGITLKPETGKGLTVNGTLTVDGVIDFSKGYSPLVASNLYGTGTIYVNPATLMANGYWTYVTILKDVSTTLVFETIAGYNPRLEDVIFELGETVTDAIAIAAKINLGESFGGLVINPRCSEENKVNGGWGIGIVAETIIDDVQPAKNPNTGVDNNNLLLGLITFSALICAAFCARRIYILNRI